MKQYIYNYAIVRFLPYKETEEFVNIGVVLSCPQKTYFNYKLISERRHGRINAFFPEMKQYFKKCYEDAFSALRQEFRKAKDYSCRKENCLSVFEQEQRNLFQFITSPKDNIIRFSSIKTGMTDTDMHILLQELYSKYIERHFAQNKEYHERVMVREIKNTFKDMNIDKFFNKGEIGNEDYRLKIPFCYKHDGIVKVVRPLALDLESSTSIYDHGGVWLQRINRLRQIKAMPEDFVMPVDTPNQGSRKIGASNEIIKELQEAGVHVIPFQEKDRLIEQLNLSCHKC